MRILFALIALLYDHPTCLHPPECRPANFRCCLRPRPLRTHSSDPHSVTARPANGSHYTYQSLNGLAPLHALSPRPPSVPFSAPCYQLATPSNILSSNAAIMRPTPSFPLARIRNGLFPTSSLLYALICIADSCPRAYTLPPSCAPF